MKINYPELNRDLLSRCPGILTEWFPQGQMRGREFTVGSTDGEKGKSLSVNINSGKWKDFENGETGDLVQLYAYCRGLDNNKAAEELIQKHSIREAVEDEVMLPVPVSFHREAKTDGASAVYEYLNAKGNLLFYVLRHDKSDGEKYFTPLSYWRNEGWQSKMPPGKRPLYGLQLLARNEACKVVIVEGEKCADAGNKLAEGVVFASWPGGAFAYKQAKWDVLKDRNVILWPDADDPGIKAMGGLVEILQKIKVKSIKLLDVSDRTGGWDVADAAADGWSPKQLSEWMESAATIVYPLKDAPEEIGPNIHFRPMGYHGKIFVFYIQATGQVVGLKGTELEMSGNLNMLAPIQFWADGFDNKSMISNALMRQSEAIGYYDPSIVRGRGVWEDSGRSVLHLGNKLIVDGSECDIRTFKTDYIYEQRVAMQVEIREPLDTNDATKLVDLCNLVRWDEAISGFLLAGWIFSSIICGVLPWRSHIYLTGPVGSGKTWVIENIIKRCLRGIGMPLQGKSTEAGLRQMMRGDARPVLFDESEADSGENAARMQRVFDLARQASSEGAAPIVKGTQNQSGALEYVFRSCFCFASIQASMTHYADESRVTLLRLGTPYGGGGGIRFQKLLKARNETLTDKWCDGLISRAVSMATVIRHNHRIFAETGEEMFGNRRAADQFAMMLAGLYGLMNDRQLEGHDDAKEFMLRETFDWEGRIEDGPIASEVTLLDTILQTEVQIRDGQNNKMLGELIADEVATDGQFINRDVLRRHGIRVDKGTLSIANSCVGLQRILKDTPWASKWNQTLINTRGARKSESSVFFASGMNTRAVILPMPESLTTGEKA